MSRKSLFQFCIMCEFSPWWIALWKLSNALGSERLRGFLEDHPSFTATNTRKAVRCRVSKDGNVDWELYTASRYEAVPDGWPDAQDMKP